MQEAPNKSVPRSDDAAFNLDSMSRRKWLSNAALVICAGTTCLTARGAAAQQKTKQAAVKYQTSPKGSAKCGTCMQFQPPDACKLVEGPINPEGWCLLYTPKAHG